MGIGGWLASMPVNAGPVLLFYSIEQGNAFASDAAQFTLLSIMAVAIYCLNYAWMAIRWHWSLCLVTSWAIFFVALYLLRDVSMDLLPMTGLSMLSLIAVRRLLPKPKTVSAWPAPSPWDMPLRVLAAIALILLLTTLAQWLGPRWSGLLTAFPIASTVIAGFAHAKQGADAALNFFRGMLAGMPGFCLFCAVLALALVPLGGVIAFALALGAQLAAHGVGIFILQRQRSH